eukprot:TRINITY_DN25535_c0_g2_i1.p2 TRINITY_DN25535_c0_g2~~TRINITY_DN25535_c0_g2_i1.p2  ORF type:complete len:108 (-),score=45.27 TRINITY_DN25535_c0_g2_i1:122-445(-)
MNRSVREISKVVEYFVQDYLELNIQLCIHYINFGFFFFFSSRRRHTRCREVSWARRCVQETDVKVKKFNQALVNGGSCLLYTSDAADDTPCVDLGGRRIIQKKNYQV